MDFLEPFDWFGELLFDSADTVVEAIEDVIDWVRRLHEDWQLIDLAVWVVPEYTPVRPEPPTTDDGWSIDGPTGVTGVTGVTVCGCGLHPEENEPSRAQREIEYQEMVDRYKLAEARAARLLWDVLSPKQRDTYEQYNWFEVITHGRRFRVYHITTSNIVEYSSITGGPMKTWCIVPQGTDIPLSDALVSQKLMLDTDPDMIYRIGVPGKYDPFRFNRVAERQSERYQTNIARGRADAALAREEWEAHRDAERAIWVRDFRAALRERVVLTEPQSTIPIREDPVRNDYPTDDGAWYATPLPAEEPWPFE